MLKKVAKIRQKARLNPLIFWLFLACFSVFQNLAKNGEKLR
jgi:hypothetical protein